MMNERRAGAALQYLQMVLSVVISLIYTPIMIRTLGQGEYGIYNLAASIISYLSLLSLGFGASYIHFYTKIRVHGKDGETQRLNGMFMTVFTIIAVIALFAGLFLAHNVDRVFSAEGYTNEDIRTARILMIFLSINLAISFPASVFTSYITSQEKFVFQKLVNMGKTVLSPMLTLPVLLMGFGSVGMVVVTTIVALVIDIINASYCIFKLKMRFDFSHFPFKLFKEIAVFSVFIAINQIVDQINWNVGKIILAKIMSKEAVAVYAVILYISPVACPILDLFGVHCLGCGMSRAVISVLRFDFSAAFSYHLMFWSLPLLYLCFLRDGKLFKNKSELTAKGNIIKVRLEEAQKLLLNTNLSIKQIAYSVGFADETYFMKMFKKSIGITPSSYRNKINK